MLIISWVVGVVWVSQQGSCSTWNVPVSSKLSVNDSSLPRSTVSKNESRGGGSSPAWISSDPKSTELPFNRQGVPVLKRPASNPRARMLSLKLDAESAIRPPGLDCSPTCSNPRKKVPAVITTDFARIYPQTVVMPTALHPREEGIAVCNNRDSSSFQMPLGELVLFATEPGSPNRSPLRR